MGAEDNGLTLEGLAQRLEALERENERMRSENAELRSKVATLEGSASRRDEVAVPRDSETRQGGASASESSEESEGRMSRRWLLSRAGAAAAGLVVAGALTQRDIREAKATPTVFSTTTANRGAVEATNNATGSGYGVWGKSPHIGLKGTSTDGMGVNGEGFRGVLGLTPYNDGYGVLGKNTSEAIGGDGIGVRGESRAGIGVSGKSFNERTTIDSVGIGVYGEGDYGVKGESFRGSAAAVWGLHRRDGSGVLGESTNGIGVKGTSSAPNLGAVEGHNDGGGTGLTGVGKVGMLAFSHTNGWIAAWGRHTANGYGVAGDSAQGVGVSGESTSGYGGQFKGGKAQLRLIPGSVAGKPTSGTHTKGEVYMDSKGTLFVCTAGDGTTVGTWKKVNMKLV